MGSFQEKLQSLVGYKKADNSHCVMVILEAKQDKKEQLKEELLKVAALSRKEKACISYTVHQDINNNAQFALYEKWTSKEDHAQQFSKPYILEFGNKLEDLLEKPYVYLMGKIIE